MTQRVDRDTIVAVATPPGRGGIGVVRVSGSGALAAVAPVLQLNAALLPNRTRLTRVVDPASRQADGNAPVLDQAVVTLFAAPHSYTGEDVVEISTHGAPVILEHVVRGAIAGGARLARPGEFTERAFLNGRLDLTEAEAVHDLVAAHTLHQARTAAAQLGGSLARAVAPIKARLVELIAALEAGIDFAEDDIDLLPDADLLARIAAAAAPLRALEGTFRYGRIVREGATLAIAGRPNAGKSSLFNALLRRDRAIVTPVPGTTRDLVTEGLDLDGIPVQLTDTAGLRETADLVESLGIARSREALAEATLTLLVVDANAPPHPEDLAVLQAQTDRPVVVALSKVDLLPEVLPVPDFGAAPVVRTSAITGAGLEQLRAVLRRQLAEEPVGGSSSALLTNLRQHGAVSAALEALAAAERAVPNRIPHEMLLLDLHAALRALDELTGATTADDILHTIFARFCIGK